MANNLQADQRSRDASSRGEVSDETVELLHGVQVGLRRVVGLQSHNEVKQRQERPEHKLAQSPSQHGTLTKEETETMHAPRQAPSRRARWPESARRTSAALCVCE